MPDCRHLAWETHEKRPDSWVCTLPCVNPRRPSMRTHRTSFGDFDRHMPPDRLPEPPSQFLGTPGIPQMGDIRREPEARARRLSHEQGISPPALVIPRGFR
ncbi:hypothetical protein GCM10010448_65610 [Streptomyces glomeratus]|uniref:Uncharacterized protein n=1 Tax=Streptomyces glomeratus TaxID=284452 RepID=A0ABP6M2Q3_9ACTN